MHPILRLMLLPVLNVLGPIIVGFSFAMLILADFVLFGKKTGHLTDF